MPSTRTSSSASASQAEASPTLNSGLGRGRSFWLSMAIVVLTAAVFWPIRHAQFINYDDQDYVTANTTVQKGLTWAGMVWAFTTHHASNWHPLTWLSHMLDCQLFGLDAGWHHVVNLVLHISNTLLLFGLLRRITGTLWRSAFVAVLFAIHPMHVESVAWVSERKDVLSTFFALVSLIFYSRYAESFSGNNGFGGSRAMNYSLALLAFALGLLAKPMIVTLPFVMLLLDAWPLGRSRKQNQKGLHPIALVLIEKAPFFVLSIASSVVTVWAQKSGGALKSVADAPLPLRVENSVVSYALYALKLVLPIKLAVFYPQPDAFPVLQIVGATLLIVGVSVAAILFRESAPWLAIGWCWFIGTLVPVLGVVKVGVQAMADRYSYFPSIGLFVVIVWGLYSVGQRFKISARSLVVGGGVVVGGFAVVCAIQARYWKDSETLFRHALEVTSGNFVAHLCLGTVLADQNNIDEAESHFRAAIELHHRFPEAHHNLGNVLMVRGKAEESRGNSGKARDYFEQAKAAYTEAITQKADYASAHENLALICVKLGEWQDAAEHFAAATQLNPENATAHFNFGVVWTKLEQPDKAVEEFTHALSIDSRLSQAHFQLGSLLFAQNQGAEALTHFRSVLELTPDDIETLDRVAWIEASSSNDALRNGADAVQRASRAVKLTHETDARSLSILAMAFAEAGDFKSAVATAEKAKAVALAAQQKQAADAVEAKLKLYREGKPFRQQAGSH